MKNKLTIVMPAYNSEQTITKAIKSLVNQSFKNWKLILVDDCSNDKTYKIMKNFENKKIKVIKNKKRLGLTKSLNKVIFKLNCEYVARMDADDECLYKRIEKQINFLDKNPKVSMLGTNVNYFNINNKFLFKSNFPLRDSQIKEKIIEKNIFIHSTVVFRFSFFKKLGGYNKFFFNAQDYDLWLRGRKKFIYANLKEKLLNHTIKKKISMRKGLYGVLAMILNLKLDKNFFRAIIWIFIGLTLIILKELGYKSKKLIKY